MNHILPYALALFAASAAADPSALRDGDLVFQTSRSAQSVAVQRATGSRYSHMGIVLLRNGKPFVFEAAGTVRYTPLNRWVARGAGSRVIAKRLRDAATLLDLQGLRRLRQEAGKYAGRPYDPTFEWSDQRMYCSELVWKIYQRALGIRIGELQKIGELRLDDPAVRIKLEERYGDRVPLEEPVVSPAAMFDSTALVTVMER
jgi:uncharacterized protein YycO